MSDSASDAGLDTLDAGTDAGQRDTGTASSGLGQMSGPCGHLDGLLDSGDSAFVTRRFAFDAPYTESQSDQLSHGAQEVLADGTAGGSSGLSEAFAFEVLSRCESATLLKTETEIIYDPPSSKKTDLLVEIDSVRVGVSVTRAVGFPRDAPYTPADAAFITDKLEDALTSQQNAVSTDMWTRNVLYVFAYSEMHADSVETVWTQTSSTIRDQTVLYVVISDGPDDALY